MMAPDPRRLQRHRPQADNAVNDLQADGALFLLRHALCTGVPVAAKIVAQRPASIGKAQVVRTGSM
jgi:hypothetical protein